MNALASAPRILLIDSNVYFSKRVSDALRHVGFEVVQCTQVSYALTMLEWNAPSAVLCATNLREMGALEMAPILRADPKTTNIALIAIGGGVISSDAADELRALAEALQALQGLRTQRVRGEPVEGLGGKRDQPPGAQNPCRLVERLARLRRL